MTNYIKISLGIFLALAASRFVPHPPNFTSLIALSFYVPVLLGRKYIFILFLSFIITDLVIGFHQIVLFTWCSILFIGYLSKYFVQSFKSRISGSLLGAGLFFLITNFGVWLTGSYGFTLEGLSLCYMLAIPFFGNTLASTLIYSSVIEIINFQYKKIKSKTFGN
tara:strand:+ start:787 stop:1281 length:495 start_codon:yes stop_codon:yes gene_type:complete